MLPVTAPTTDPMTSLTTSNGLVGLTAGILINPGPEAGPFCPEPRSAGGFVTTTRGRTVLALISGSSAELGGFASRDGASTGGASLDGALVCGAGA